MNLPEVTVRVFRTTLLGWVALFAWSGWAGLDAAHVLSRSPLWVPAGPLRYVTHALPMLDHHTSWGGVLLLVAPWMLLLLALHQVARAPRWWVALPVWWLYLNLMHTGWLSGSGGQQLVANLLFWNIALSLPERAGIHAIFLARTAAFWILRMQVLLAYAATGLHKLTGTLWLEGTALGVVATDPAFGPAWIAGMPLFAHLLTWAVFAFQLTFPLAVWWHRTRLPWMAFGVLFHGATALWMGIPEMGFAFIAAYPILLAEREAGWLVPARWRRRLISSPAR